jgi:hypothetical protein
MAAAAPVHAVGFEYTLQTALGYSDDINESAVDPVGEAFLIPRMNFQVDEQGASLQAKAVGDVEYRDYLGGDFDNELRGQLSSIVNWTILPQSLNFDFEDYASVAPVDILATNAPNNLQQTNVFTLGPSANFRVDPTLNFQTDLRLTNSAASQTEDFDSNRVMGALRAIKLLDPTTQLSANVTAENVHFTDAVGDPDYQRDDAYARYQRKLADLDLDLALGYTHLDFSDAPSESGVLTRGSATWHVSTENSFSLGFARQFSDAAQDMSIDPTALIASGLGNGIIVGTTAVTSQVYLQHQINGAYVYQTDVFSLRIAPYYNEYNYELATELNQTAHGGTIGALYRLTPLWTIGLDSLEETRRYTQIDRRDEDLRLDFYLTYQLTRQWSTRFDLIRNERNSTAVDQGFRENIAMLALVYKR